MESHRLLPRVHSNCGLSNSQPPAGCRLVHDLNTDVGSITLRLIAEKLLPNEYGDVFVQGELINQKLKHAAEARKAAAEKEKAQRQAAEQAARAQKALIDREFELDEMVPKKTPASKTAAREARLDFMARLRAIYGLSDRAEKIWQQFVEMWVDKVVEDKPGGAKQLIDFSVSMQQKKAAALAKDKATADEKGTRAFSAWVLQKWEGRKKLSTRHRP